MKSNNDFKQFCKLLSDFKHTEIKGQETSQNSKWLFDLEDQLIQYSNAIVKDEIDSNILQLDDIQKTSYLNRIEHRLISIVNDINKGCTFTSDENSDVFIHYAKTTRVKEVAIEKIRNYINTLKTVEDVGNRPANYSKTIFRSDDAQRWFIETLEALNAFEDLTRIAKRGLAAKANAIFKNNDCKRVIFNYDITAKAFIDFLNRSFDAKIKNHTRLSDSQSHEDEVKKLIAIYLHEILE